jgi:1,6-anhydro-N-acetylmuramate kinase
MAEVVSYDSTLEERVKRWETEKEAATVKYAEQIRQDLKASCDAQPQMLAEVNARRREVLSSVIESTRALQKLEERLTVSCGSI